MRKLAAIALILALCLPAAAAAAPSSAPVERPGFLALVLRAAAIGAGLGLRSPLVFAGAASELEDGPIMDPNGTSRTPTKPGTFNGTADGDASPTELER